MLAPVATACRPEEDAALTPLAAAVAAPWRWDFLSGLVFLGPLFAFSEGGRPTPAMTRRAGPMAASYAASRAMFWDYVA